MITLYELQERYQDAINSGLRALEISIKIFGPQHLHGTEAKKKSLLRSGHLKILTYANSNSSTIR